MKSTTALFRQDFFGMLEKIFRESPPFKTNIRLKKMSASGNLVTGVPVRVGSCILTDWLNLKDVSRLDSAILARRDRLPFLQLTSSTVFPNASCKHPQLKPLEGFTNWLNLRSIRVKSLSLHGVPAAVAEKCLELSRDVLTYLSLVTMDASILRMGETSDFSNFDSLALPMVARLCTRLQHFVYDGNVLDWKGLHAVLDSNPHIRRLDLIGSLYNNSASKPPNTDVVCPQLRTITCSLQLKEEFSTTLLPVLLSLVRQNTLVHTLVLDSLLNIMIRNMIKVESSEVMKLLKYCPGLRVLSLQYADLDNSAVNTITTLCPRLQHVNLSHVETIDDFAVKHLAQNLQLRSLHVDYTYMSHQFLMYLKEHAAATLQTLSCANTPYGHADPDYQAALKDLLASSPSLTALSFYAKHKRALEGTAEHVERLALIDDNIDNGIFEFVGTHCESLKVLSLLDYKEDTSVDEEHIQQVIDACFNLHTLVAWGALQTKVAQFVRDHYQERLPNLTVSRNLSEVRLGVLDVVVEDA